MVGNKGRYKALLGRGKFISLLFQKLLLLEVELGVWWSQKLALFFDDSIKFFKVTSKHKKMPCAQDIALVLGQCNGNTLLGLL